jgi:hypothetical protein
VETVTLVIGIVLAALLFTAVLLAVIFAIARTAGRAAAARAESHMAELGIHADRQSGARSLGVKSLGRGQVRGNGVLSLAGTELIFTQAIPAREWRIPVGRIQTVDTARSHLGKWVGATLLRVAWIDGNGSGDSIALQVSDLDGWLAAIEAARVGSPQS